MKRAIFVRSKTIVMTELDKKIREKEIYRVTLVGSFVNFLLVIFKFLAGIAGHSAAMLADAVHSLSDFITDVVVILFVRISNKPVDKSHDYGHGKYETLATAFIGMALLGVGFGILWNGATDILVFLRGGELRQPGMLALAAAIISILLKEILYQYTVRVGKRCHSQAVVANAWHHRSDGIIIHWYGCRYWRSDFTWSSLGGTRSYCRCDSQFLYYAGFHQAAGSLPG